MEIMIVVAIIGLLAAVAIPNFIRARSTSQQRACVNNLRVIDAAKQQWALETGQMVTATPGANDIRPYLGRGIGGNTTSLVCPVASVKTFASSYTIGDMGTLPVCLILSGGDADGNYMHMLKY